MLSRTRFVLAALAAVAICVGSLRAAPLTDSLKKGTPDIKSAGALAFGTDGVLFVGDSQGSAIFAIDTGDNPAKPAEGAIKIEGLDGKIGSLLGIDSKQLLVNDLAVNPASGNAYLSVSRGRGPDAKPVILRVTRGDGKVEEVKLDDAKFAKIALPNPNERQRQDTVTDIAFVNGKLIIAGLSSEQFASKLRVVPFPSTEAGNGASVEIYHGAHGALETRAPVRTFVPYDISGETNILAAYQCTPLVRFPVSQLKPGEKIKGTTIAELGNRNRPLDMITYTKDGKDYLLLTNSSRGVMKIPTAGLEKIEGISSRISGTAGAKYETISDLKDVMQMDKLDNGHAILLTQTAGGPMNLTTIALP